MKWILSEDDNHEYLKLFIYKLFCPTIFFYSWIKQEYVTNNGSGIFIKFNTKFTQSHNFYN